MWSLIERSACADVIRIQPEPNCALAQARRVRQAQIMSVHDLPFERMSTSREKPPRFRPSELRKMKGTEQVAAVCYRIRKMEIEFLLVRTRGGRWIFPKGSIESGLTNAQAAALEAFEEAGVHGRMEEASFARYSHGKRAAGKRSERDLIVHAHLCEVSRLGRPKEEDRRPTWFSVNKAKRRLQQKRKIECARELVRTMELAVARIRALDSDTPECDALREVQLEVLSEGATALASAVLWNARPRASFRQLEGESSMEGRQFWVRGMSSHSAGRKFSLPLRRLPQLTSGRDPQVQKVNVIEITAPSANQSQSSSGKKRGGRGGYSNLGR